MTDGSDGAAAIYADTLVWDAHSGFGPSPEVDLSRLAIWKAAGIGYLSINVGYDLMDWRDTVKSIAAFRRWIMASADYRLVRSVGDIGAARAAGQMAVAFDIEGMNALDGSLDMVQLYYDLGVRPMLFADNRNNLAGGGCHDRDAGLTEFGRAVIGEMNRLGMVVDCSHCGHRTTMEAMELSKAPVVFSHSNARRLHDHERNIRDEQAKACAATGGVVGVNGVDLFLAAGAPEVEALADHIAHYAGLIGAAHVGIGLDYAWPDDDGGEADIDSVIAAHRDYWPESQYPGGAVRYLAPSCLRDLTASLLARRFDAEEIRGILGGNFMRVARQVWR